MLIAGTFALGMVVIEGPVTCPMREVFVDCARSMQRGNDKTEEREEGGDSAHDQPLAVSCDLLERGTSLILALPIGRMSSATRAVVSD